MNIFDGNAYLLEIVEKNWICLLLAYQMIRSMFPDNKVLKSIGESFSGIFPVFRKKE
jgi:hypothetical protein